MTGLSTTLPRTISQLSGRILLCSSVRQFYVYRLTIRISSTVWPQMRWQTKKVTRLPVNGFRHESCSRCRTYYLGYIGRGTRAFARKSLCSSVESGSILVWQTYVSSSIHYCRSAVVQSNNHSGNFLGVDPLDVKVTGGITMTGTSPTFFRIPVTLGLIEAVNIQLRPRSSPCRHNEGVHFG